MKPLVIWMNKHPAPLPHVDAIAEILSTMRTSQTIGGSMDYECMYSARDAGWVVEAIDYDNEGVGYRALFTGPDAEQRAREYAEWKYAAVRHRAFREGREFCGAELT